MRVLLITCCCVIFTTVAAETKTSLEDIEKDNLKSEKRTIPVKSPSDYGFLPVKTAADYARQQPKEPYVQAQYIQPPAQPPQKYATIPQVYYHQAEQQHQQQQQQINPYQQYENVQYITDNNIAQQQQQYYNTPQYVYLQQYTAPSTQIQAVVDPKGGIQYVMYIPASYLQRAEQSQNLESVVYADAPSEAQYVPQAATPGIQYAEEAAVAPVEPVKANYYDTNKEPKSLLDSYVPSILQVQYYKQQEQARANALLQHQHQSLKSSAGPVVGKVDYVKSYRPIHHGAESVVNYHYQIPTAYHK